MQVSKRNCQSARLAIIMPANRIVNSLWFYTKRNNVINKNDVGLCSWIKLFLTILNLIRVRSSRPKVFCEKGVLRNFAKFTGKNLCQSNFFKKETLAQVFSSEFCEIPKNTFSYRIHPLAACVGLDALTSAQEYAWPLRTTHWYLPLKTLSANLNLFNTRKNEKTRYF